MRSIIGGALLLGLVAVAVAYPAAIETDPELGDKFEGDIVLSTDQRIIQMAGRNGLIPLNYRWPNNTVYYRFFEGQFDEAHKNHILRGMQLIEEVSCIRFVPADATVSNYINITGLAGGCYSNVGYLGRVQVVNYQVYDLDTGCFRLATIVHEFLHTLGFYHQQSASDRDEYVKIVFENIQEGKENNFHIYNSSFVEDFGIKYDYGSVMHYGPTAFTKNGEDTIIPLDPTAEIGQRRSISAKDIYKLNIMYKCPIQVK